MINKHKIFYMVIISVGFYIVYSIWGNVNKIKDILLEIPVEKYFLYLLIILFGYVLRFIRWQFLLKSKKIDITYSKSMRIFLVGMAMAISPGKLGEFIKTYYIKKENGTDYSVSLPIVALERISDILSIVVLISFGLFQFSVGKLPFFITLAFIVLGFIVVKNKKIVYSILTFLKKKIKVEKVKKLEDLYEHSLEILTIKIIGISTVLSIGAWFCECFVLYLIFQQLNIDIEMIKSLVVFSLGTLLGAISMIPGGVGVAEGSMTGIMMYLDVNKSASIGITILIRLLTLWFGTILGFVVWATFKNKNDNLQGK